MPPVFATFMKGGHDAKHMEMEGRQTLSDQIADPSDAPVIRINLFEVDPVDPEAATRLPAGSDSIPTVNSPLRHADITPSDSSSKQ